MLPATQQRWTGPHNSLWMLSCAYLQQNSCQSAKLLFHKQYHIVEDEYSNKVWKLI